MRKSSKIAKKYLLVIGVLFTSIAFAVPSQVPTYSSQFEGFGSALGVEKITNDNFREIIVTSFSTNGTSRYYINNGLGEFPSSYNFTTSGCQWYSDLGVLASGNPKKSFAMRNNGNIEIYNNINGSLSIETCLFNPDLDYYCVSWGSVLGNSYDDIACALSPNNVVIYRNDNDVIYNVLMTLTIANVGVIKLAELDNLATSDTKYYDLICGVGYGNNPNYLKIYKNNYGGSFTLMQTITLGQYAWVSSIKIADLNLDGYNDIIIGTGNSIKVYKNNGNLNFIETQSWNCTYAKFGLGEFNYDGFQDMAYYDFTNQCIRGVLGNGDCTFDLDFIWSGSNQSPFSDVPWDIQFADLKGYGGQVIVRSSSYRWYYYANNSDEIPCPPKYLTVDNVNNHPRLQWKTNTEDDIDYYEVWRRYYYWGVPVSEWECIGTKNHPDHEFIDYSTIYLNNTKQGARFFIKAVDNTLHTSNPSNMVTFNSIVPNSIGDPLMADTAEPEVPSLGASPNPFNPDTHIEYCVPEAGLVRLAVYDVKGRVVADLVNGVQPEGEYAVRFDGRNLPSGVYFARLVMGRDVQTYKLLLVK